MSNFQVCQMGPISALFIKKDRFLNDEPKGRISAHFQQNKKFRNLGVYMLSLMLHPFSNASTEVIFSMCGSLKTKF